MRRYPHVPVCVAMDYIYIVNTLLGADISNAKKEDAGPILSDAIRQFMYDLQVDDGISSLGYTIEDIPKLVESTLPQTRVTKLAPDGEPTPEEFSLLFEQSLKNY